MSFCTNSKKISKIYFLRIDVLHCLVQQNSNLENIFIYKFFAIHPTQLRVSQKLYFVVATLEWLFRELNICRLTSKCRVCKLIVWVILISDWSPMSTMNHSLKPGFSHLWRQYCLWWLYHSLIILPQSSDPKDH